MKKNTTKTNDLMKDLLPCPFCGFKPVVKPVVKYIGNEFTPRQFIIIKCSECSAVRIFRSIVPSIDLLENTAAKCWNTRVH